MRAIAPCAYMPLLLLIAAAPAAAGALYHGRAVAVTDGRTLTVLIDKRRTTVRIDGIRTPTRGERHAIGARQSLIAVCGSEPAVIEVRGAEADGTLVGRVSCNGVDAAAEQLRRGMATMTPGGDAALAAPEAEARAARRGVWSRPMPGRERAATSVP